MKTKILRAELPAIATALKEAINQVGEIDEIYQDLLVEKGLDSETAEVVMAIMSSIDRFNPPIETVMREIGDLAS